jgi:hypothetical protein
LRLGDSAKRRYSGIKGIRRRREFWLSQRPASNRCEMLDMGCEGRGAEFAEHERTA